MVKPSKSTGCRSSSDNTGKKKQKNKFSVYDFNLDDNRVEKDSQRWLSKFKTKNPKFSGSPVDKYSFLHSFAEGAKSRESYSKNELLNIDDSDDNTEEMTCPLDAARSSIWSNHKSSAHSPVNRHYSDHYSPGARSCLREEGIKPGGRTTCGTLLNSSHPQIRANNQALCVDSDDDQGNENLLPISVDSDDDCRIGSKSLISTLHLAKNEGLLEKQPSDDGSSTLDVEAVVIVNPDIIIFGEMYSTSASLAFSNRHIKVEGSSLGGTKNSFSFNWSISDIVKIQSCWYGKVETARVELYLKSQDEKLAIINSQVSDVVKLNFAICDPCWSERQEAIESLDAIYKVTWNTVIDSSKAFEGIIYPKGDSDAVSISMKDIQLLQPATFINDTIIDFYIKYLEQKLKPKKKPRFHFFNSFFFRKLVDDKSPLAAFEGRAAFQRVCKWTRKVNLFEKDYLFIPVNFSLHWSLIVVCHPGEVAYYEDKEMEKSMKFPCILHMDSIKGSHRGLKNLFQSYLLEEWRERNDMLSEDVSTKFLNLPFKSLELPQQENSFDCGLFLLYFVERFLEEAPVNFNPYTAASEFLNKEWFPPAEASGRRGYIKNILYRIVDDNVQTDPQVTNCYDSSCNEIEGGSGKELPQETCNGRDPGSYSPQNADKNIQIRSREATTIRSLQHSGGLNLVPGDSLGQGDTAWPVAERIYRHCMRLESVKRVRNIMPPIEEEETKGKQTVFSSEKTSSRLAELTLFGTSMPCEYENRGTTSETFAGKCPISLEIQDEDNLVPEAPLVLASEERTGGNESFSSSSEELVAQVVEDSYESGSSLINDNGNHRFHDAKSFAMCDHEVDSPCKTDCSI